MTGTIPTRRLGSRGPLVSAIAYGNWLNHGDLVGRDVAVRCVRAALDAGITTFDTADEYAGGRAEEILGSALAGIPRESVRICTKVFFPTWPGEDGRGLSRRHVLASCDASLRRLRVDHLDLYQAHRFDPEVPLEETLGAFADLVAAGKVRHVGVSEWTAGQLTRAVESAEAMGLPLVSNQAQYSLLWRVPEAEVVPLAARTGLGHLAYSPLAQGVLTGKYRPRAVPGGSRAARSAPTASIFRHFSDGLLRSVRRVRHLVEEAGLGMPEFALAWVLRQPTVSSVIIGASSPDQIRHNVRAAGLTLDPALVSAVDSALSAWVERDPAKTGRGWDVRPDWRRQPEPEGIA
jgi:aryl-alcohol dehydrogenase-like predicted oxidoreductase